MELDQDLKNRDAALNRIYDIAVKAHSAEKIPAEVGKALDAIISLSRYKFDVIGNSPL